MAKRTTTYTARMGGASWRNGPVATFATIRECRAFAESYGTTADWCRITNAKGHEVAMHRRGNAKWYRAEDDGGARQEAVWQARMGGDMDAY